ncbi:MAG: hypothetical protein EBZ17_14705, partial [Actinobacteria bacterium]|nr:hypothetical protein [Actinomycetota bacterium]
MPKSTKVRVRIVTTDAVEAGVVGIPDGELSSAGFAGKPGDTHVHPDGKRTEVLIGIGDAADVDTDAVRRAAAAVGRRFGRYGKLGVELPETELDGAAARQALVEGVALSTYTFTTYKSDAKPSKLATVEVAGGTGAKNQAALDRGAAIARGQRREFAVRNADNTGLHRIGGDDADTDLGGLGDGSSGGEGDGHPPSVVTLRLRPSAGPGPSTDDAVRSVERGVPRTKHIEGELLLALFADQPLAVVPVLDTGQNPHRRAEVLQDPRTQAGTVVVGGDHLDLSLVDGSLELLGPDLAVVAVIAVLCARPEFAEDDRFPPLRCPALRGDLSTLAVVPAVVLVHTDHIDQLAERV